ncbi:MAG: glycosyltransferase family 2 protein [Rhodospirillales bacterium]|nr:MAG: glycosyltransferase family 2 protein [Rhodospirillales bacterium]
MAGTGLSILVLTRDEEANLPVLLASAEGLGAAFVIVDSGSTDRTVAIAEAAGCRVVYHPWETYAAQLNWAIEHAGITTPWVMRMDADERFTPELVAEMRGMLAMLPDAVTGLLVKRQVWFWGRWIRHGGYYPIWLLRVWRSGRARCEQRWMDEHMVVDGGEVRRFSHDIIDENHKGLTFWTDKHNRYADREVRDILSGETAGGGELAGQAGRTRWLKGNVYLRAPMFLRAFLYWFYRYVLRLGFLDGRAGLVFHFLQGFWYRFLVDAKLHEARRGR